MTVWSDEKRARLVHLVEQGLFAAVIGERLGLTKNAVVGMCGRMGLHLKHRPMGEDPAVKKVKKVPVKRAVRVARLAPQQLPQAPARPRSGFECGLIELGIHGKDNKCRYIAGEVSPFDTEYCGAPCGKGGYCADHSRIMFIPNQQSHTRRLVKDSVYQANRVSFDDFDLPGRAR